MVLLLSLVIALLPLRYAFGGMMDAVPGKTGEMTSAMAGCVSLDMAAVEAGAENPPCPGHELAGDGVGNCCGDHCGSSAQLFPSVELSLYAPAFFLHYQDVSLNFPNIFLSPRHRPPLSIS